MTYRNGVHGYIDPVSQEFVVYDPDHRSKGDDTPTTDVVRSVYSLSFVPIDKVYHGGQSIPELEAAQKRFDEWLSRHNKEVYRRGYNDGVSTMESDWS
jgi:hypothetical protein